MSRRILVTSALPNANGSIHLGHLLEHIQTDIWVRFQRLRGNPTIYVCADDTHGTATMLKAEEEGITPEALIERVGLEHAKDFRGFLVEHDNYHSTHAIENKYYCELIYNRLQDRGLIFTREVEQLYDPERNIFLADRFVKGTCPKCGSEDQYGDNCEECSATYDAMDLKDPRSVISGATPILRISEHYFFDLPQYANMLATWLRSGAVQPEVANKLDEWLEAGLRPWDISRDAPYFGFLIPGTTDKYFYVWVDAPIGYMASFKHYVDARNELTFDEFWDAKNSTELHHFIGKDIINFHALLWPAMLDCAGFRKPTKIHVHGFVTVDGTKMSKSRGTFINASTYLEHLEPEYLRYYFAAKSNGTIDDIDINMIDFVQRVNSDLVGKVVNIASRCAGFLSKQFDGRLADTLHDEALWNSGTTVKDTIAAFYESGDTSKAMREITALADRTNQYIAQQEPWTKIKDPDKRDDVQAVCSQGINIFRLLVIYLKPVLPQMAMKAEAFLNVAPLTWADLATPLTNHTVNSFEPLFTRMDRKALELVVEASKEAEEVVAEGGVDRVTPAPNPSPQNPASETDGETMPTIGIEEFTRVELKVAKIIAAEAVADADKLIKLTLDVGDHERYVFSGIKAAYDPAALVGRLTVVVANLAPRKMRFGVSEGMVLAAGPGGDDIFLISPDDGAKPGMIVR
ncbi:MAG: methionine--tRNA ligase [Gammaproteobacteria bacterium]|nr:MAG: methionine--tRNA ligase [Gammaproteobacteria bacterium]